MAFNMAADIFKLFLNVPRVPVCFVVLLKVIALGLSNQAEN